jgi:HEAT repeat protein
MLWWKLRQLRSRDHQARRRGVKGLGKSRDPRAIDPLMAALNDKSYLFGKRRREPQRTLATHGL